MSLCTAMCGLVFGLECRHGLAPPLAGRLTWCTSLKADAVSRKLQTTDLPVSIPSTAKVHFRTALQDFYCPWCHTTVAWVSVHSTGKAKLVEVKQMDLFKASCQLFVIISSTFLQNSPPKLPFYQKLFHELPIFNKIEKSRIVYASKGNKSLL